MHLQEVKSILNSKVNIGSQEYLDNIPLPQFQIENNINNEFKILIYSSLKDSHYHSKLIDSIKADLPLEIIKTGISHPKDNPNLKFIGTISRLNQV